MDMMDAVLGSLSYASASQMSQYSMSIAKQALATEAQDAAQLLDMLPQQQSFQVRGPQPGDIPEIAKGQYFDIYA